MTTKKHTPTPTWVWEPGPRGWRQVPAHVPPRSRARARGPRPPRPSSPAPGVRAAVTELPTTIAGYSERELREGVQGLFDKDTIRRIVREVEDLVEAIAKSLLVPFEIILDLMKKIGGAPGAAMVVYTIYKHEKQQHEERKRRRIP